MKESELRIRFESDLREAFLSNCKREGLTAAQVRRTFMRSYVEQKFGGVQPDLWRNRDVTSQLDTERI